MRRQINKIIMTWQKAKREPLWRILSQETPNSPEKVAARWQLLKNEYYHQEDEDDTYDALGSILLLLITMGLFITILLNMM